MAAENYEFPPNARSSWLEMNPVVKGELVRMMVEGELACPELCRSIGKNVLLDCDTSPAE